MIQDMDRCKQDGDYFRLQLGTERGFLITYDLFTEESIEAGDTEDGGYDGYESCEPDEFDEDGITAVDKAVRFLTREHSTVPTSSYFQPGVWYEDSDDDMDYRTGETTRHAYHPTNFSETDQAEIFARVK